MSCKLCNLPFRRYAIIESSQNVSGIRIICLRKFANTLKRVENCVRVLTTRNLIRVFLTLKSGHDLKLPDIQAYFTNGIIPVRPYLG